MTELSSRLVESAARATYVAAGGELPRMERHYQIHADELWRPQARAAVVAVLRELAENAMPAVYNTDPPIWYAGELQIIADGIEAGR